MRGRLLLAFAVLLPFLFVYFFTQAVTFSFEKLGLSPGGAFLLLLLSLIGGLINLPLWRRQIRHSFPSPVRRQDGMVWCTTDSTDRHADIFHPTRTSI